MFILNNAPYGSERSYKTLRLARQLGKTEGERGRIFLMDDTVACAKIGQKVPDGYYNAGDMVSGEIRLCGTCLDAHGIGDDQVVEGTRRSTLKGRGEWTAAADEVLVF